MAGNLKRLRYWCYKVLPLVYDDSLSYYEVLCKVVDYINHIIEELKEDKKELERLNSEILKTQKDLSDLAEKEQNDIDSLTEKHDSDVATVRQEMETQKAELEEKISTLEAKIENEIKELTEYVDAQDAEIENSVTQLREYTDSKDAEIQASVTQLREYTDSKDAEIQASITQLKEYTDNQNDDLENRTNEKIYSIADSITQTIEKMQGDIDEVKKWIDDFSPDYLEVLISKYIANMIYVYISDSGYVIYYIPSSWADIQFNTTGWDITNDALAAGGHITNYEYGRLVLSMFVGENY